MQCNARDSKEVAFWTLLPRTRERTTMLAKFEFVNVEDPISNPKPGKSLQIRSRCMQGKNKRVDSRRSVRERKRQERAAQQTQVAKKQQQPPNHEELHPVLPARTLISDLALIHFAGSDIDAESKSILFKAFAYNVANQSLSPLDRAVDFDSLESDSFEWLFKDASFLHSVLCASYAVSDLLYPQWDGRPGQKTLTHLRKTLLLLQEKMSSVPNVYEDESVLVVVQNLALLSAVFGDWEAAAAHFKGLKKIVELRGNLDFLASRPKLHFKLDRIDLAYSLSSGKQPFFLHPSVKWDCTIPPPYLPLPADLYFPPMEWDWRLANVFRDFQHLALRINRNSLKRARHDPACFQAVLTSLQSRLIHLRSHLSSPVEELVRLTMLAFLTTTFKAPGRKIPYGWVSEQLEMVYKESLVWIQSDLTLRLWVLVTAGFTVSAPDAIWLKEAWGEVSAETIGSWENVRAHLLRVMFIELIHEKPGMWAFQELQRSSFWDTEAPLLSAFPLSF